MKDQKRHLVFDIETMANPGMEEFLETPTPAKNIKDPEKIAKDIAKKKASQRAKMALSPLTGRIACICVCALSGNDLETGKVDALGNVSRENTVTAEAELIKWFFDTLENTDNYRLVTFNGKTFDVPFLWKRACMLGIELPPRVLPLGFYTNRYNHDTHCDLCQIWADGWTTSDMNSLELVAGTVLGVKPKCNIDRANVAELMETPEGRTSIFNHCLEDVKLTASLYRRSHKMLS